MIHLIFSIELCRLILLTLEFGLDNRLDIPTAAHAPAHGFGDAHHLVEVFAPPSRMALRISPRTTPMQKHMVSSSGPSGSGRGVALTFGPSGRWLRPGCRVPRCYRFRRGVGCRGYRQ